MWPEALPSRLSFLSPRKEPLEPGYILDGKLKIVNEKQTWHQIKTVALTAAVAFEHFEAFFCICPQLCGGQ